MRILPLPSAYDSLTQHVQTDLASREHAVKVAP